jgi:hypothetical protein
MDVGSRADRRRAARKLTLAAGSVLGLAVAAMPARAETPTTGEAASPAETRQQLLEQLRGLQQRVEQLEQPKPNAAPQTAPQAAPAQAPPQTAPTKPADNSVESAVRDATPDAERRSQPLSLAPQGFTAGYDNGKFLIQSEDGAFVLNPNAQMQFRWIANSRDNAQPDGDDEFQSGFELRRLKLAFDGNVFGKDNVYHLQWATSRTNGNLVLEEAYLRHKFADRPWAIRGGQYSDTWAHESTVSSKRQLTVERSLVSEILINGGVGGESYIQGVSLIYDDGGALRGEVTFQDGINSRNTNFTDTGGGSALLGLPDPHWGVSARLEYKFAGDWKQYDDFTAMGNQKDLLVLGGGVLIYEADGARAFHHTVDVQWEPQAVKGLSVYGAYVGLWRDFNATTPGGDDVQPYDWGFLVQAGYMLNDKCELFARYDYMDFDTGDPSPLGAAAGVSDSIHEITIGVNYYLQKHAAKFTVDAIWLPNGCPVDASGTGVLAQTGDDSQFVLRAQFQLLL